MPSHAVPSLTVRERLGLIVAVPRALTCMGITFLRFAVNGPGGIFCLRNLRRAYGIVTSSLLTLVTPRHLQWLVPSTTGDVVRQYCAANNVSHTPIEIRCDDTIPAFPPATLHFIGCEPPNGTGRSGPYLLYFHGGGYVAPLQSPALGLREAAAAGVGLALLEYSLAPTVAYPGQLAQAVAALRYLAAECSNGLGNIIVAGESAGGNLSLALLAHLQQPRPGIPELPKEGKLRGVLAVSPRTRNEATKPSYETNASKDWISKALLKIIGGAWKPEAEVWAAADLGDEKFWQGARAERLGFVVGGNEVYRDDVVHTGAKLGADVLVCEGEAHIQCQADLSVGVDDGEMMRAVESWLKTLRP